MHEIPFSNVWWGHIFTGSCVTIVIFALSGLISWIVDIPVFLGPALVILAASTLVVETLSTIFDRWYAKRVGHDSPGGWVPTVEEPLKYCTVYPAATAVMFGGKAGLVALAVSVAITTLYVVCLRPWEPGLSREEHKERWEQFMQETREELRPDAHTTPPNEQ